MSGSVSCQAEFGVLPADQGLDRRQRAAAQFDDGLVVHGQFAGVDGSAQPPALLEHVAVLQACGDVEATQFEQFDHGLGQCLQHRAAATPRASRRKVERRGRTGAPSGSPSRPMSGEPA
jgi:hypothetical protein